jgi:predicted transcriptional regulator
MVIVVSRRRIVMTLPQEPLSPAQQEIMEIVWDKGEVAAVEVRQLLARGRVLARETVRTTLERMEEKGWLKHRVVGRTFFYSAAVPRGAAE